MSFSVIGGDPDLYFNAPGCDVASWCPTPDGTGPATQVHLVCSADQARFVVRLKSGKVCDSLIEALQKHRADVFGPPPKSKREG